MKNIFIIALLVFILSGCMPAVNTCPQVVETTGDPAGFLLGLWHGVIVVFSFIASLLTDANVYETNNTGWPYNLGYLFGLGAFGKALSFGLHLRISRRYTVKRAINDRRLYR